MLAFKYFIFYGSYLAFPFIALLFYYGKKRRVFDRAEKSIFVFFVLLTIFFIDVRFVEPNIVTIDTTKINIGLEGDKKLKIAVIADTHLGIYVKSKDIVPQNLVKLNIPKIVFKIKGL